MQDKHCFHKTDELLERIKEGAFLTVKAGDTVNTMTIGWASLGIMWFKQIFTIAVRNSRYTYSLLEKADSYTVSIPDPGQLTEEILFCGTRSGRDVDKFSACDLFKKASKTVDSPIIDIPGIHYECSILCTTPVNAGFMDASIIKNYSLKDYHTLYLAEIINCYELF